MLEGKILVAEDNGINRMFLREVFEMHGLGYDMVDNGQDVCAKAVSGDYDVILMDINMPQMNGMEALRRLRDEGVETPVVALTANNLSGDREHFLGEGFDGYLAKPIGIDLLVSVLETYCTDRTDAAAAEDAPAAAECGTVLDMKAVRAALPFSDQALHKLLGTFSTTMRDLMPKLRQGIVNEDGEAVAAAAHAMRGSAGVLRLSGIETLLKEIEAAAKSAKTIPVCTASLDELERKMAIVFDEIAQELNAMA